MSDVISEAYVRMLNPIQSLNEDTLMEDRIDWLKQNTKSINIDHDMMAVHIEPHAIINFMANHVDPTRNKVHTQHLIRMYNNGAFRQEDAPRVKEPFQILRNINLNCLLNNVIWVDIIASQVFKMLLNHTLVQVLLKKNLASY